MKNLLLLFSLVSLLGQTFAQSSRTFKVLHQVKTSPLKDQQSSGTCWSFATTSFIETEAIRLGKEAVSLSPIYYVAPTYLQKAEKYIDRKGKSYFDAGDLTFSVLKAYQTHGAVPESVYNGVIEGDWQHDHVEMDNLLAAMVESVGASGYGRIKPQSWRQSVNGVLKAYLGEAPPFFEYKGLQYTPKTFAEKFVGINPDNYVEITSYSHLPFYEAVTLNIPANWDQNKYLNLPINELEAVIDHALQKGYSLAWDGDISESGFLVDKGIAELPLLQEQSPITQTLRQSTFEDESTTDDHNMHLIGRAEDAQGRIYYLLKNSEGNNEQGGYIYMSKNYLLLKTISLLVSKYAIPQDIKSKTYLK
ncbi:MAG: C1 family peptidase [Bacteroidota bacterium]